MVRNAMTPEKKLATTDKKIDEDVILGFKNAYFDFIDEYVGMSKKMFGAAIDGETDIVRKLAEKDPMYHQYMQMFESSIKNTTPMKNAKTMISTFADTSLAWQKVMLEAQKAGIQIYANWMESIRAYGPKN
jgi:hypothetical protein